MLEIFRKNVLINSLLLLPYVFLVRIGTFLLPQKYTLDQSNATFINSFVYNHIDNLFIQNIIASILVFLQALLVNYIFINQKISRDSTQFAGVFYVPFVSLIANTSGLTAILMANTFLLLALHNLLNTYKNINPTAQIFNSGFMIATASLFYVPYFAYFLFGIIAILQLRSFNILEKLQYFIGFITPYFLIFSIKYWFNIPFIEIQFFDKIFFRWPDITTGQQIIGYTAIGVILLVMVISILVYGTIVAKKAVQIKKKIEILYWLILFSIVAYSIFNTQIQEHILSLAVPLSFLVGILSSESKNKIVFELFHLILIIIVVIGSI